MNIVFLGYGELGATLLRGIAMHHHVSLVVTHRFGFSNIWERDVEDAATELSLPLRFSRSLSEIDLVARIRALDPDIVLSMNWRTKVPPAVLQVPSLGAINVHDALLPQYAGFGAVNWAIRNGETETGVTVHYMEEEFDTGPVLTQSRIKISQNETGGDILSRLMGLYVTTALEALEMVACGNEGVPQKAGDYSFYHRIGVEDTRIDWRSDSNSIYNLIRAQSDPYINSWTMHNGSRLWIKSAALPERVYGGTPGRILIREGDGVVVACGSLNNRENRGVVLLSFAVEEGPVVQAVDYFRSFNDYLD